MKSIKNILFTSLCVYAVFSLSACIKRTDNSVVGRLSAGTWTLKQLATDDNNNEIMDNSEVKDVPSNDVETFLFSKNGQGVQKVINNGVETDYTFTWSITGDFNYLQRIMQGGDTLVAHINTISDNTLILENDTQPVKSWYILHK